MPVQRFVVLLMIAAVLLYCPHVVAGEAGYPQQMATGETLYWSNHIEDAKHVFRKAASMNLRAVEPRLALIRICIELHQVNEAIENCREVLSRKPTDGIVCLILSNLLRQQAGMRSAREGKLCLEEAFRRLSFAEEQHVSKALCQYERALLYLQDNDLKQCERSIDSALLIKPAFPEASLLKGVLLWKRGEKMLSLERVTKAIKEQDKYAEGHCVMADILFALGKHSEACVEYTQTCKDDPLYWRGYVGRGNVLMIERNFSEALRCFEKARDISGDKDKYIQNSIDRCRQELSPDALPPELRIHIPHHGDWVPDRHDQS